MAGRVVSVSRSRRSHRLGARVDAEQAALLTLRPAGTPRAPGRVGRSVLAVLVYRVVVAERRGNAACGPIDAVDAVRREPNSISKFQRPKLCLTCKRAEEQKLI
jgi:hypothetical protein